MTSPINYVRKHIREMPPYQPILPFEVLSEELGIPVEKLVKLDANENPYGPVPEVKDSLARLNNLHIYPDPESRQIRNLLAEYHQIPVENILIGAGADELIDLILRIVIEPVERIINCPPTFCMYAFDGKLNRAELVTVPRKSDFSIDVDQIESEVGRSHPKILFLANPNNPDGGLISEKDFERLVKLPLLLVMDEAYINFCDQDSSVIQEVLKQKNLIVLRTFSKWAGLAGMRIGYGVFPEELVPIFMKAKQPYNVSVAAEKAAVISIKNKDKLDQYKNRIIQQRQRLFDELKSISWLMPYPSHANFILCLVEGKSAAEVSLYLRQRGILIRYFNKPGLQDFIRISVGTEDQIDILLKTLRGVG